MRLSKIITFTPGTSTEYKQQTIKSIILMDFNVKVALKDKLPIYGKLIALDDAVDLLKKGMVRFVSDGANAETIKQLRIASRIFNYDNFTEIKIYEEKNSN